MAAAKTSGKLHSDDVNQAAQTSFLNWEWPTNGFAAAPTKAGVALWSSALEASAQAFQNHTDYLKSLAACHDLPSVIKCNSKHLQETWSRSSEENAKLFEKLREVYASVIVSD